MGAEAEFPNAVIGEAWSEYRYPQPAVDKPTDRFMRSARVFQAATARAVASELERLADEMAMRTVAEEDVRARIAQLTGNHPHSYRCSPLGWHGKRGE